MEREKGEPGEKGEKGQASFLQTAPRIGNQWKDDAYLQQLLARLLPSDSLPAIRGDLSAFGERVAGDILDMSDDAGVSEPSLLRYDAWGRRVDRILTARGWRMLHDVSAEEGLVAIAYERANGPASRLHWAAKSYLFAGSAALYNCPLAMTDGAARLIETLGDEYLSSHVLPRLTSRSPPIFWTSGQWMTERKGGSDVRAGTETMATPLPPTHSSDWATHSLTGVKWFSSATDCDMAFALARERDPAGNPLTHPTLFFVRLRDEKSGELNNIQILQLKHKLGTRQLPTAELQLHGTLARKVGESGRGIKLIATMVNITRVWNSLSAVGNMRRAIALARDYAARRHAFGRDISHHPLHVSALAAMETELRGCLQLVMFVSSLQGMEECGVATAESSSLLRLLTPVCKLYTGKRVLVVVQEAMEAVGGQAYIEHTGFPELLRDSHVLPIWEGTTNIQSLDVLRAIRTERPSTGTQNILEVLVHSLTRRIDDAVAHAPVLEEGIGPVRRAVDSLVALHTAITQHEVGQVHARRFAFGIARTTAAVLLLEQAAWCLAAHPNGGAVPERRTLEAWVSSEPLVAPWSAPLSTSALIVGSLQPVPDTYRGYGPTFRSML